MNGRQDIPVEALQRMTIGAWRRRMGISDEQCRRSVRWLIANEMVIELQRISCIEEMADISRFVNNGAALCAVARRLRQLANRLHSPAPDEPTTAQYPGGHQALAELLAAAVRGPGEDAA